MKRNLPLVLALLFSLFTLHTSLFAANRAADWRAVADAQKAGQPKTASAALDKIITGAIADETWPEAVRAILAKTQIDAFIEEPREQAATAIRALNTWLADDHAPALPASMRPLLEAALAKTWWEYYQANRWHLLQRTQTSEQPSDDFLTWDARRVLAKTAQHFEAALANPSALQRTPIDIFEPLIAKGELPDTYRPTLYDFLINEAIAFYSAGDQGVSKSEDAFEPEADSPILGSLEEFLAWNAAGTGSAGISPSLRAVQLYQQLLRFHLDDPQPQVALTDADLHRINWAASLLGQPARERHLAALRDYIARNEKLHVATTACLRLAQLLESTDPAAAYAAAQQGIRLHPRAPFANDCRNLIARLDAPSLQSIMTERTWAHPAPEITIRYRNQQKLYLRAIPCEWEMFLQKSHNRPENISRNEFNALLASAPAKEWTTTLPPTPDHAYRDEKIPSPTDLSPGFYFIVASFDESFSDNKNLLAHAPVWVSDLAIIRNQSYEGPLTGYVVNATTGEPQHGVTLTAWRSTTKGDRLALPASTTEADGSFTIPTPYLENEYPNYVLLARAPGGQAVASPGTIYLNSHPQTPASPYDSIVFFADRSIYRPGQEIRFKGVVFRSDNENADYTPLAQHTATVILNDPNGKEAARVTLTTNDFGSLSGSFTVPAGRLTGYYRISTTSGERGATGIRIEEYKRPKFEVTLPAPETAPKLDSAVTLTGTATAYTGAPIDGAKVTWRVRRIVRWPRWCAWFLPRIETREIAHDTIATDAAGKFTIQFTAHPDKTADAKNEPIFDYTITAEVTDTTGETRTASRTISVGYTALAADISAAEWQTDQAPVTLKIKTTTLDGISQSAQGTVAIHALKQPDKIPQARLHTYYYYGYTPESENTNPADIRNWPESPDALSTHTFTTDAKTGLAEIAAKLPAGLYRAIVSTKDRFGKTVAARTEIRVLAPDATRYENKQDFVFAASSLTLQPGDTFTALWGSGYDTARALVSFEQNGKILRSYWTDAGVTQQKITLPITESMRGGVTLRVFQVRDNRLVSATREISVPWETKKLKITWEHFNSKLVPGGRETWTARITGPDAEHAAAEFAAALYDASLDQFSPHQWSDLTGIFRQNYNRSSGWGTTNDAVSFRTMVNDLHIRQRRVQNKPPYRHWASSERLPFAGINFYYNNGSEIVMLDRFMVTSEREGRAQVIVEQRAAPASPARIGGLDFRYADSKMDSATLGSASTGEFMKSMPGVSLEPDASNPSASAPDLAAVTARKNLNETAFFFPQLLTDSDGSVRMEFTVPEALTRWKFLGFAHDKQLRSAILTDTAVTAKDLMVQPNPPRFLREGDTVEFTVKVTNMTDKPQTGSAQLTFADASTLKDMDIFTFETIDGEANRPKRPFTLAPNSSKTISWRIYVSDGQGFLTYKAVASTGAVSDGEEGFLPVLSRRQLVTESITLPVRDKGTYTFRFPKLAESETSALQSFSPSALRHESLTVQMTSNPAWYAVLALPNLMEYPHECTEQLFNRYYANALAAHIANSDPKIARVFEQWRNTPALESPLLKNEDLKSVLIEETPWLRDATRESENRRAIGNLFDANRTAAQTQAIIAQLAERQMNNGLWAWFPGGRGSDYITRYLVAGFARLRHFGIPLDNRADTMLKRAVTALDAALAKHHAELIATKNFNPDGNHIRSADAFQLYTRSFYLKEIPIPDTARAAYDFYTAQARKHWLSLPRQSQGHAALALARMSDTATPAAIVTSLKQHAKNHDELGMYWADTNRGWFWWQAPIETQALMIEVFDEVARDTQAVSDLQLWLLKQKQTQAWPSTKATADAVYALLLRGADKLASDALVTVSLGGKKIEPAQSEAGTGYYRERIPGPSITPSMGEKITVTKTDAGPAWGGVTWQYLQTIDKITPHEGTPLTLKKTLWKQINTSSGPTLVALDKTKLEPGDTLIARIELRTDRDMEFVHLKDQRGSGTEPVNVLSGYRWKNGLGYYESTRDTATHFFMDWLSAGTHVFEYPVRVQLRGVYESGIAEIQCMYAPEYNSHSASTTLVVE
ncbi:alpha-2-macroglobulin family protein [Ereboglobus luteus]|nr:alpha-2-macroglobulin family protein [Ereboglobus luteus]